MTDGTDVEFFGAHIKVKNAKLAALLNSTLTDDVTVVGKRALDLVAAGERDDEWATSSTGPTSAATRPLSQTSPTDPSTGCSPGGRRPRRTTRPPTRDPGDRVVSGRCILCSVMPSLLSIVVPVFNEAGSLEPLYQEIADALGPLGAFEVVFVDDGSTDGSITVMERLAATHDGVRVVRLRRNFGKAAALTHGFAEARGDVIVTMDGDRQDDPAEIPKLLVKLDQGYDLVSGWKQSRQDPLSKTLPSKFFNWTVRKSTGVALHDFNCGLKAYRREVPSTSRSTESCTATFLCWPATSAFASTEEKVAHRRRTTGRSKYGWRRYARGYLDLLTVLFLGRSPAPAAPVRRHRHDDGRGRPADRPVPDDRQVLRPPHRPAAAAAAGHAAHHRRHPASLAGPRGRAHHPGPGPRYA